MVFKKVLNKFSLLISKVPGHEKFGPYRFLPVFFIFGATIEFAMIHWRPNGINFYEKFKAKRAHELAAERYLKWKEIEELCNT